jgi:hypothetical protein
MFEQLFAILIHLGLMLCASELHIEKSKWWFAQYQFHNCKVTKKNHNCKEEKKITTKYVKLEL